MKSNQIFAAALAFGALAFATVPVQAADTHPTGSAAWEARWISQNLDATEVARYQAMNFSVSDIQMLGNIALRTDMPLEYLARRNRDGGIPIRQLGVMYGVTGNELTAPIPNFGASAWKNIPVTTLSDKDVKKESKNLWEIAKGNPDFTTFMALVKAADWEEALKQDGPITVLVPTNAAFGKLSKETLDDLMKPENKNKLRSILTYHVVPGKIMAKDVMRIDNPAFARTVNGASIDIKIDDTGATLNGLARVTATDMVASNGVIHVIDTVLTPPL